MNETVQHDPADAGPNETTFATIEEAVADLREGRMVLVVDDADRENEGDFIMAAESATPEDINFMVTHGRGIVRRSPRAPVRSIVPSPPDPSPTLRSNRRTTRSPGTSSRSGRRRVGCSAAPAIPRPPWTWRPSRGCSRLG